MSRFWTLITHLHTLAGPVMMLLYPLLLSKIVLPRLPSSGHAPSRIRERSGRQNTSYRFTIPEAISTTMAGDIRAILKLPLYEDRYASVVAIETTSKLDDEQWLAYWILYSFLTLMEMLLEPMLQWIPIWYDVKLLFVAWLVLPQFRGAAFIYNKLVREKLIKKYGARFLPQQQNSPNGKAKTKTKFVDFISPKKGDHEVS